MKLKILADFQICISVPLIKINESNDIYGRKATVLSLKNVMSSFMIVTDYSILIT